MPHVKKTKLKTYLNLKVIEFWKLSKNKTDVKKKNKKLETVGFAELTSRVYPSIKYK